MKLAIRIIAVSLLMVLVMFVAATWLQVRTAYEEFESQHRDLAARVAAELVNPLLDVWKAEDLAGVDRLLRKEGAASHVGLQLRWVWFQDPAAEANRPNLQPDQTPSPNTGQIVSTITTNESGHRQIHAYVTVDLAAGRPGGLEVTQSLEPLDRMIWRRVQIDLAQLGTLALVFSGIACWTGISWIAHPLQALAVKTQRIGRGDFSSPLTLKRNDEFGELAAAINEMCCQLEAHDAAIKAETAERMSALEQLRHADRLKTVGRLAAGIAHEMGTPLNVISGRATLIVSGKLSTSEIASSAATIRSEADRITRIMRQLLDFARHRTLQRTLTRLRPLTVTSAELLRQLAEKVQVKIEVSPGGEDSQAFVDAALLQQVLANLVMNAIQAMPNGGTVCVQVHSTSRGNVAGDRQMACISVSDEGIGINKEDLPHVFEPFFTTKDLGQGTGLGLSIAHGIILEHGGWIEVCSEVGRGTKFDIFLPMEQPA